jgi:hypothetical protein
LLEMRECGWRSWVADRTERRRYLLFLLHFQARLAIRILAIDQAIRIVVDAVGAVLDRMEAAALDEDP